ncbi:MAG: hypothetical protein N2F24_03560, partial [Deltaproteobacteria bacterium]
NADMKVIKLLSWGILIGLTLAACSRTAAPAPTVEPTDMPGLEAVPNVDVDALIRIHTPEDVEETRLALLEFIFGEPILPEVLPEVDTYSPDDDTVWLLNPYKAFDTTVLTLRMAHDLVSNMVLVNGSEENDTLLLYYTGHAGLTEFDQKNTVKLARAGYDVLIIYLPMKGLNDPSTGNNPVAKLETKCCGVIRLGQHHHLNLLERPISYFLTPVAAGLNYAESLGYSNFVMIGFSGGGWATTVYAALDLRISISIPVAGTAPLWMRIPGYEDGDFEASYLELYEIANYLELYVIGAYGEGRYQNQVVNFFDPCCYGGGRAEYYVPAVQTRLKELGAGKFDLFIDRRHTDHAVGENTYNHILNILENGDPYSD